MQFSRLKYFVQSYKKFQSSQFFCLGNKVNICRSFTTKYPKLLTANIVQNEDILETNKSEPFGFIPYEKWMGIMPFSEEVVNSRFAKYDPDSNPNTPPGRPGDKYTITNLADNTPFTQNLPTISDDFTTMSQIDYRVRQNLVQMNINRPNDLQQKTIALFDAGHDFLVQSNFLTGKTIGCLLPLVSKICQNYPEEAMHDVIATNGRIAYPTALIVCSSNSVAYRWLAVLQQLTTALYLQKCIYKPNKKRVNMCNIAVTLNKDLPQLLKQNISLRHLKYLLSVNCNVFSSYSDLRDTFADLDIQTIGVTNLGFRQKYPEMAKYFRPNSALLTYENTLQSICNIKHNWELFESEEAKNAHLVELINQLESDKPIVVMCANPEIRGHIEKVMKDAGIEVITHFRENDKSASLRKRVFIRVMAYDVPMEPVPHVINTLLPINTFKYMSFCSLASTSITNLFGPSDISGLNLQWLYYFKRMMGLVTEEKIDFFDEIQKHKEIMTEIIPEQFLYTHHIDTVRSHFKDKHFYSVPTLDWIDQSGKELPVQVDNSLTEFRHWDGIHRVLVKNLQKMNVKQPSIVQQNVFKLFSKGHNIVVQSERTSGKTLSYLIPIVNQLMKMKKTSESTSPNIVYPTALILQSSGRIVQQTYWEAKRLLNGTNIQVNTGVSDHSSKEQFELSRGCQMLMGTPYRVTSLLQQDIISLSKCKYVVIDDADCVLSSDHSRISMILSSYPEMELAQTALFSDFLETKFHRWATENMKADTLSLVVGNVGSIPKSVKHHFEFFEDETIRKDKLLKLLREEPLEKILIICHTIDDWDKLSVFLKENELPFFRFNHYDSQNQRFIHINKIVLTLKKTFQGLVIPPFTRIINCQLPSFRDYLRFVSFLDSQSSNCSIHNFITYDSLTWPQNINLMKKMMTFVGQPNDEFFEKIDSKIIENSQKSNAMRHSSVSSNSD